MDSRSKRGFKNKPIGLYFTILGLIVMITATLVEPIFRIRVDASGSIFTAVFFFELFALISSAVMLLWVCRFSFLYFLTMGILVFLLKIYGMIMTPEQTLPFGLIVILSWAGLVAMFLYTPIHIPYLNAGMRWWTQPSRFYFLSRGVLFHGSCRYPIISLDISRGGAFIKVDQRALFAVEAAKSEKRLGMFVEKRRDDPLGELLLSPEELDKSWNDIVSFPRKRGDKIRLQIHVLPAARNIFEDGFLRVNAEVAWSTRETSTYRYGLGVKFTDINLSDQKKLGDYIALLEAQGFKKRR